MNYGYGVYALVAFTTLRSFFTASQRTKIEVCLDLGIALFVSVFSWYYVCYCMYIVHTIKTYFFNNNFFDIFE